MTSTGLLVVSNIKQMRHFLRTIEKYVNNLYVHLNIPSAKVQPIPTWGKIISQLYADSYFYTPGIDLKILVTPLKTSAIVSAIKPIDVVFSDSQFPEICETVRANFNIPGQTIYLTNDKEKTIIDISSYQNFEQAYKVYDTVVLGGTFDRIHVAHKIMLTQAVLRSSKRLVVGITDVNMTKNKILPELILPVDQRIQDVREFLMEIDSTLQYDIVAIQDPFGPTQTDPNMDMIVVSSETLRGGQMVNEIRAKKNLSQLDIFSIDLVQAAVEDDNDDDLHIPKETKISSSNTRLKLLGTRIKAKNPRPNLPSEPYIIGLTGGLASGKSSMAQRFVDMGAYVLDCDKIAHECYEPGKISYEKIIQHFGDGILDPKRRIDRFKLGAIVFSNPEELAVLNGIVWPVLLLEVKQRIRNAHAELGIKVVIIEAAVLLSAGWETECHEVWSMIISPDEAVRRLVKRNNFSEEEARKRIATQLDNRTIVQKSNVVFSSEWSTKSSQSQAEKAWSMLMSEIRNA